jgi:carboxymethylenebutenolidase
VLVRNVFYTTARPPVFPRGPEITDEQRTKRFSELSGPLTPETIERDAQAFVEALASQEHVSGDAKFGVAGYCFTGALAMRYAAARPDRSEPPLRSTAEDCSPIPRPARISSCRASKRDCISRTR